MKKFLLLPFVLSSFSLFAEDAPAPKGGNYMQTIIMLVIALVFFYFILLRPEQKRRKQAQEMRSSMKKGDKVTAMGIVGTIDKVNDTTIILKTYDGTKIEMLKAAITEVQHVNETESTQS
ncbi:MAG: preprotein translocase subunit YajC [Parachlamydiales bacterium]|jgi:preprotein translocase subunit YajC